MAAAVRITNRHHALVRRCRALAAHRESGAVLLDGEHLVTEAIAAGVPIEALLTDDRPRGLALRADALRITRFTGSAAVLDAASPVRTSSGVVAIAAWKPMPMEALVGMPAPILIGLVDVQDPGNVGGVIRTADALGADGVLVLGESADPSGWKALRGAMGSTFRLPIARASVDEALTRAHRARIRVAATVIDDGQPLDEVDLDAPLLILVGNEGAGLPHAVVDAAHVRMTIPMRAGANSLNVGISAALCLWEARRRHAAVLSS